MIYVGVGLYLLFGLGFLAGVAEAHERAHKGRSMSHVVGFACVFLWPLGLGFFAGYYVEKNT